VNSSRLPIPPIGARAAGIAALDIFEREGYSTGDGDVRPS
jgi:hypothetical protein